MSLPPPPPPGSVPPPPPASVPPPPPISAPATAPRRFGRGGWIALGLLGVLFVVGLVLVIPAVLSLRDRVDELARADVPGRDTVALSAGDFVVYAEYPGAHCTGVRRDSDGDRQGCEPVPVPTFDVRVTDDREQSVPIGPYGGSLTYDFGGHDGRAIGTISIPADGEYTVASTGQQVTIAIGPSIGRGIVRVVLTALLTAFSLIGAIVLGIVMIVRRASARR